MQIVPSLLRRLGSLNPFADLTGWLSLSLVIHGAFLGWLADQAALPTGGGTAVVRIALIEGGAGSASGTSTPPQLRALAASPNNNRKPPADIAPSADAIPPALPAAVIVTAGAADPISTAETSMLSVAAATNPDIRTTGSAAETANGGPVAGGAAGPGGAVGPAVGSGVAAQGLAREEARPARQARPEYPSRALAQGWQGQVLLRLLVAADGTVQQLQVEQTSGHAILDRAASRAARTWIFFPARENGVPVAAEVRVPVIFASEER